VTDDELLAICQGGTRNLTWGERVRIQKIRSERAAQRRKPEKKRKWHLVRCEGCNRIMRREVK
jgi:hypothetical protein